MTPAVTWAILDPDGTIAKGRGFKPPKGWFNDVKRCLGLALQLHGYPPIYAVRPVCSNDVEKQLYDDGTSQEHGRWWGVTPEPGSQVWFFPDGCLIGFGRDTNEVQRLVEAFQGKLKAQEVLGGPDQRGHAE